MLNFMLIMRPNVCLLDTPNPINLEDISTSKFYLRSTLLLQYRFETSLIQGIAALLLHLPSDTDFKVGDYLHTKCRKDMTRRPRTKPTLEPAVVTRAQVDTFDFTNCCVFCGRRIVMDTKNPNTDPYCLIETLDCASNIHRVIGHRNDDRSAEV